MFISFLPPPLQESLYFLCRRVFARSENKTTAAVEIEADGYKEEDNRDIYI